MDIHLCIHLTRKWREKMFEAKNDSMASCNVCNIKTKTQWRTGIYH